MNVTSRATSGFRYAICALAVCTAATLCGCTAEQGAPPPPRSVKALRIADPSVLSGRTFPGKAEATQEVDLAFEVSGTVISRLVNKGDQVQAGDLLAQLDPRDYQNERDAAQAESQRARAYRDRIAMAARTGAVSLQDLTDAEARLNVAIAQLNIKQKALDDTRLTAPFSGVVAATYVEQYQRVIAKQKVLRLLDLSQIEMTIDIPENLISYIPYVSSVWCRFDAFPDRTIPARIKEIGAEASNTTRTYPVTIIMEPPDAIPLLPGMAGVVGGSADLPAGLVQRGVEIPVEALFSDRPDSSFVWIITKPGNTVTRHQVTVGNLTPRGIMVTDGLAIGDLIAIAGVSYLQEGQQVVPQTATNEDRP